MSLIQFHNITKTYITGETTVFALNDVDLSIKEHELVAIVGESGSGKSTMMHIIGLLDRPTQGRYTLNGRETLNLGDNELALLRNRKMGFIFQAFFLLWRFNAAQNIMLPLLYRGFGYKEAHERAIKMLEKLELIRLAENKPNQMSGGQLQRIAIGRALVGNPDILLADEPTGALDSRTSQEIINLFLKLHDEDNKTVIIVTHDQHIAKQCERIISLKDGKIIDDKPNVRYAGTL